MAIERNRGTNLAAQELVNGHAAAFPQNVPKRSVDAAERVVPRYAGTEIGGDVGRLPDVFDLIAVLSDDEGLQVVFQIGGDGMGPLAVGGAADAVKARFAGQDLYDDQVVRAGLGEDHLEVRDLDRRHAAAGGGLGGSQRAGPGQQASGGSAESFQSVASVHGVVSP